MKLVFKNGQYITWQRQDSQDTLNDDRIVHLLHDQNNNNQQCISHLQFESPQQAIQLGGSRITLLTQRLEIPSNAFGYDIINKFTESEKEEILRQMQYSATKVRQFQHEQWEKYNREMSIKIHSIFFIITAILAGLIYFALS